MFIRCLRKLATSQKESVRTALCLRGNRWDRSQVMSWWFIQKSPTCLCYTFPWIHPLGTPGTRVCQGMISSFQMSRDISVYQYNCSRSLLDSFSGNESRKKKNKVRENVESRSGNTKQSVWRHGPDKAFWAPASRGKMKGEGGLTSAAPAH